MSIKFRVLGGGFWGGGKCRFYFYGREDFSDLVPSPCVRPDVLFLPATREEGLPQRPDWR